MSALPPGSVVGILGGGQLGRMMAQAAPSLDYRVHIFCPDPASPAMQVTPHGTIAEYDDHDALARFADAVDVVTCEFESVPAAAAAFLASRVPVRPNPDALAVCQHRVLEKTFINDTAGLATTPWGVARSAADVARLADELGRPCALKSARFGYDGKAQVRIDADTDPADAWLRVSGGDPDAEAIVEAWVTYEREISVVVARGVHGDTAAFDPVWNVHRRHILHRTFAPAPISVALAEQARHIATTLAEALDYCGVMGVELFVTPDQRLLVNEIAPRPHNSGHWTLDATVTSQFEQAIRAVAGLPLGSPRRHSDAVMTNLLGEDMVGLPALYAEPESRVHIYGKSEARYGRKMGHVTRLYALGTRPDELD